MSGQVALASNRRKPEHAPRQDVIQLGEITITVARKDVKHVNLSVNPPNGGVILVIPTQTSPEAAASFAASKLHWIRNHQARFRSQARETPREYVGRESHYLWGKRCLLDVSEKEAKPTVQVNHHTITLTVRPGSSREQREAVMRAWYKSLLHDVARALIHEWEPKLGVEVSGYRIQRMKTKWGTCNYHTRIILLNTELAKKPKDLVEYVVVHEMVHLIAPNHGKEFVALMDRHYRAWREARVELNELPLAAEDWRE